MPGGIYGQSSTNYGQPIPPFGAAQNPYGNAAMTGAALGPWGAAIGMGLQLFGAFQSSRERRKQWKEYSRQMDMYYRERNRATQALQYPNIQKILSDFYGPGIAREPGKLNVSRRYVPLTPGAPTSQYDPTTGKFFIPNPAAPPGMAVDPSSVTAPGGLQARQAGGPVQSGQPYLVGEQGPEVVVPQQSGTVLPNQTLGSMGGPNFQMESPRDDIDTGGGGGGGTGGPQAPPATGGAAGTTPATTKEPTPGELITYWMTQLLQSPGKTGTFGYEQAQEHANRGLGAATRAISGEFSGRGLDPGSGMGQTLQQSAINTNAQLKATAARDFAALQESLFRQDIAAGEQMYQNALANALGLAGAQSNSFMGGNVYPNIGGIPSYNSGIGQALGMTGYWFGQQYGNPQTNVNVNTGGGNTGFGNP